AHRGHAVGLGAMRRERRVEAALGELRGNVPQVHADRGEIGRVGRIVHGDRDAAARRRQREVMGRLVEIESHHRMLMLWKGDRGEEQERADVCHRATVNPGVDSRVKRRLSWAVPDALTIGAVATLAGVRVDTIRYYERIGLLPK